MKRLSFLIVVVCSLGAAALQTPSGRRAVPAEPITTILEAFESHRLVVLGEAHGRPSDQAFRLALIRDSRFAATVNDVVVESGNAQFQDVMDRFMTGEDVPDGSLRQVWLNAAEAFHAPMYEAFFRAVRTANDGLTPDRRIRVVLGEAPDHRSRDAYAAAVIRREVVDRRRRALVIYGNMHTIRRQPTGRDDAEEERTLVTVLENSGEKVYSVWGHGCTQLGRLQPTVTAWPRPSLAGVAGTVLGRADFAFYSPFGAWRLKDGEPVLVDGRPVVDPPRRGLRMEQQVDAVLCL